MAELNHLRAFTWVVLHKGFAPASRARHVAQSALSRSVRLLEESLGFQLLERQGRVVELTDRGREVFELFREAEERVSRIETLSKDKARERVPPILKGHLRIAVVDALAVHILNPAIVRLSAENPALQISVETLPAHHACERLVAGEIHAAIQYLCPPRFRPFLQSRILNRHAFHLVAADRTKETLRRFIGSRAVDEILPSGMPGLELLRSKNREAEVALTANSILIQEAWCRSGAGVALLPSYLLERAAKKKGAQLREVPGTRPIEFDLLLLTRRGHTIEPSLDALIGHCGLRTCD